MESSLVVGKNEWDLSGLLSGLDDPDVETDLESVRSANEAFATKWRDRVDYLTDAEVLREALDDYEALCRANVVYGGSELYGRAGYYLWLREKQDSADTDVKAKQQQAVDAVSKVADLVRFFELSLGKTDLARQREFILDPRLAAYRHFLERIFAEAKHQLSEPEEKILSVKSVTSHRKWVQLTEKAINTQQRPWRRSMPERHARSPLR